MSITVERAYRLTLDGTERVLTEPEAMTLASSLLAALGIEVAPGEIRTAEPVAAAVVQPPALPSGPVTPERSGGLKMGGWGADLPELRRLYAEGTPIKEIARQLDRTVASTQSKLHSLGLRRTASARCERPAPVPGAHMPPKPEPATVHEAVVPTWTTEQTTALIRAMGTGGGGIREAAERTGHTMGSCALRWKHLKAAGTMTLADYVKSPEATA